MKFFCVLFLFSGFFFLREKKGFFYFFYFTVSE